MTDLPALECRSLAVHYGPTTALDDVDLATAGGETVALLGPSGSGKTTLLSAVAGIVRPDTGEIRIDGRVVSSPTVHEPPERRSVSMVFQNYALWPHLSAVETVAYPLRRAGVSRTEAARKAGELLELVGIAGLGDRRPSELSGGQQQRVGLARALARRPAIYLFDEPTAHLDPALRTALQQELADQRERTGATALYATHDAAEALAVADRVAEMRDGRIVQVGTPVEIYERPVDVWSARLTGSADVVEVEVAAITDGRLDLALDGVTTSVAGGGTAAPGRHLAVIRPEWTSLDGPRRGTVTRIWFAGSHTDLQVDTGGASVRVRALGATHHRPGSEISWKIDRCWIAGPAPGAA